MDEKLTSEAVDALVKKCLFKTGEPPEDAVIVKGVVRNFRFNPTRISECSDDISGLLSELPDEFQASRGGGWSFLNACNDRHGRQWTDAHQQMEALFCLGIAAGKARWLMSREMWGVFPGGMPYVSVN